MSDTTAVKRRRFERSPVADGSLFFDWRNADPLATTIEGITYKIASSREEREAAFRLVYQSYTSVGLMEPNDFGMRVTPYHLLPTSEVFIAMLDGNAICTLSLIGDGELGIPMEVIYGDEVNELRARGSNFGEVSCLADRRSAFERQMPVLVRLIALMLQYARHNGVDQVLLAVHPRHEAYYRRLFGCTRFGELKSYPSVLDNPAVACSHEFARLDEERYPLYDRVYGFWYPPIQLQPQPMLEADRAHFRPVAELCGSYVPTAAV